MMMTMTTRMIPTIKCFVSLCLLAAFFMSGLLPAETNFLAPLFLAASSSSLEVFLRRVDDPLKKALAHFHLHEAYSIQGKPHLASAHLRPVEKQCDLWESENFRNFSGDPLGTAAALCALTRAQILSGNPLLELGTLQKIQNARDLLNQNLTSAAEKMYVDGRLFLHLPPHEGRDLKKSLVSFTLLEGMLPQSQRVKYWLARAHAMNGNRRVRDRLWLNAEQEKTQSTPKLENQSELLENSQSPTDYFSLEKESKLGLKTGEQAALEGYNFGAFPGLSFLSGAGLGGFLSLVDERVYDSARSARLDLYASTRGNLGADLRLVEATLLDLFAIEFSGGWSKRKEDVFALGIGSSDFSTSHFIRRFYSSIDLARTIASHFYLKMGWRFDSETFELTENVPFLALNAPSPLAAKFQGPWGEFGWDSRDSQLDPFTGHFARVQGYFPTIGLGSSLTFEKWNADIRSYFVPRVHHGIVIGGSLAHVKGDSAPFAVYPDLLRTLSLPGTRLGRFRDRNAVGGFVEYQRWIGGQYWLAGFGSVGTLASDFSSLWSGPYRTGGGLALLLRTSAQRRLRGRLEAAIFDGAFVLNAGVGTFF